MHPALYIRNIEAIFIVVLWAVVEATLHVVRELPQDLSTGPFLPNPLNNTVGERSLSDICYGMEDSVELIELSIWNRLEKIRRKELS